MRTFVDARIRRILAFAPQKELRLNFFSTFFTGSEIQGLQVSLKAFIRFAGGGQVGERGLEVRLARRGGDHLHQEARDGIVGCHQHAIARASGFESQTRRGSKRVEQPTPSGEARREPSGNRPLFERRQEAGQQAGVGGTSPLQVRQDIH